jgi:hypothetical protein
MTHERDDALTPIERSLVRAIVSALVRQSSPTAAATAPAADLLPAQAVEVACR